MCAGVNVVTMGNHTWGKKDIFNIIEINLIEIIKKLQSNRKSILKAIGLGFIIGSIIAFSLPKAYKVNIALSPESGLNGYSNSFAGMASMLGIGGIGGN